MYRVTLRLILVLLTFVPFMSARTVAAELSFLDLTTPSGPTRGKSYRNIMLEGEIANGDFAKLKALANGHNVAILTMRSPGGDVLEAIKIAEFLNERLITAEAPLTLFITKTPTCRTPGDGSYLEANNSANCVCNSACAIVWLTAPMRMGDFVGIHRSRFDNEYFSGLNATQAKKKYAELIKLVSSFLSENEVPTSIISKMMSVSSGDNYILTEHEIQPLGNTRPYLEEMILSRCSEHNADLAILQELRRNLNTALNDPTVEAEEITRRTMALWNFKSQYQQCAGVAFEALRQQSSQ